MNWGLFLITALVGIIAGVLRRGGLTSIEAWTVVLTRLAMAAAFGALVPEQLNSGALILLAGRELTQLSEYLIAYTADRAGGKMEGRRWLNRSRLPATLSETKPN